jgi:predicted RNA-binding Zn-ribbon protein involved in translation (DUF1610 family)
MCPNGLIVTKPERSSWKSPYRELALIDRRIARNGKMTQKCPECGSEKIIPNVKFADVDYLTYYARPDRVFFPKPIHGKFSGQVCGECGHISLRAEDPAKLWQEYQEASQ